MKVDMVKGVLKKTGSAVDKAVGGINNNAVQLAHKSLHITSGAVQVGGKAVKIVAKTPFKAVKMSRAITQKVRLAKQKTNKLKVKTSGLFKVMRAEYIARKYVVKPGVKLTKSGVKMGAAVADTVIQKIGGDDTVKFAKSAYNATKVAANVGAKTTVKGVKTTWKVGRTILTKKGRRGLVTNVKRKIKNIITAPVRLVRNVKNAVNNTVRAAKFAAKLAANFAKLAAQAVAKLAQLIASTAPWSLIVIGVLVLMIIIPNVFTALVAEDEADNTAGLVSEGGDNAELLENMEKFNTLFAEAVAENITDPLKTTVTSFCDEDADPPNIIVFNDGDEIYPANKQTVNSKIDDYVSGSLSSDRFASMLAALKVFKLRVTGERPEEMFTKDDFKTFIGTVNGNTCIYGDTFFIKTTETVDGQTCPDEDCRTDYCENVEDCESPETDDDGNKYCPGHDYCDNDHKKMTVTLKTVEEYYSAKEVPEIYSFDEEESVLYDKYKEYLDSVIEEAKGTVTPSPNPLPDDNISVDYDTSYDHAGLRIGKTETALIIILVLGMLAFSVRKRGG